MNNTPTLLYAYTDGACSGNPGPGGWGVLMSVKEGTTVLGNYEMSGGDADTTNNRMELMAAISALESLKESVDIIVVTDSVYVKEGISSWLPNWKRKNWHTASNKPVKNADLWQRLDAAQAMHTVEWQWIKGHKGHIENERADELARAGMAPYKKDNK